MTTPSDLIKMEKWDLICNEYDHALVSGNLHQYPKKISGYFLGLLNSDRISDALDLMNYATQHFPNNSRFWRNKGIALQKTGAKFDSIQHCYREAIDLSPKIAANYKLLAKLQFKNMDYVAAIDNFEKAIDLGHESASTFVALGRSLVKLGMREKAVTAFEKSLQLRDSSRTRALLDETSRQIANKSELVSSQYYDDIFRNTEKYSRSGHDSVYVPVWKEVIKFLEQEKLTNIIDLGCGPAQFSEYLSGHLEISYLGVDFSAEAVKIGQDKCPHYDFINASIFDLDYSTLNHDVILCLEVLEHIPEDLELLRTLPSGSKLVASVPDYDSFGHLRVFKDKASVVTRYGSFLTSLEIKQIKTSPQSCIWLFKGILR